MSRLLVLGGARSGKSAYAQARAEATAGERLYLATAQAFDGEMATRIARHQADRSDGWTTVEVPVALPEAVADLARPGRALLVDCLTLWTSNLLLADHDAEAAGERLAAVLAEADAPVILVANEVGLGIVPDNALARRFRDAAGRINQAIARIADEVQFVAAGLPLRLK